MASVRRLKKDDPDSPWVCEYTDAAGRRRRITPKTGLKKDAEAARRRIEAELERGEHTPDSDGARLSAVIEEYVRAQLVRARDGRIQELSVRIQDQALRKHVVSRLGATKISALKWTDVTKLYTEMMDGGLAPVSAKRVVIYLERVEKFARRRGYTRGRAVSEAREDLRGVGARTIATFTIEQVRTILETADSRALKQRQREADLVRLSVHLAAVCGLRWGEIFGLRHEDVDQMNGCLCIRRSWNSLSRKLKPPKTAAGVRDVPMPHHIATMLAEWMRAHGRPNDLGLIFTTRPGAPIKHSGFHKMWLRLTARADVPPLHFHALRHFASSAMIAHGLPLPDVASLLGHARFDMTLQVYAHPIVGGHRRSAALQGVATALLPTATRRECDMAV